MCSFAPLRDHLKPLASSTLLLDEFSSSQLTNTVTVPPVHLIAFTTVSFNVLVATAIYFYPIK